MANADTDVKDVPVTEAPDPASSPEENKAPATTPQQEPKAEEKEVLDALKSDDDKPSEDSKKETEEPAETEQPDSKEEEPEEAKAEETKPPTKGETRKSELNSEIRDLVAQRNQLRTEVEKINEEVYKPATEEELVEDGMSEVEAKVEVMRQEREVEKYNERVAEAQLTINTESQRVLQDFPMFRQFEPGTETMDPKTGEISGTPNPAYDAELAGEAAQLLQANLITDPNTGQVIGSNVSPYQLYKTLARASGISTVKGQEKGQAAIQEQLANADDAGSAAPPSKAKDPILEILASDD
jgi:hypothetical protein